MSENERPLPKPPTTPFGRRKQFEQHADDDPLIADEMAMAMAEGKLDQYINTEMADNEQAKKLAMMMMGMTGMADMSGIAQSGQAQSHEETGNPAGPPEDLVKAASQGDVKSLMEMLRREHEKMNPGEGGGTAEVSRPQKGEANQLNPSIEREIIESLAAIADENSLTMDWLVLRAMKLYVQEYRKTGRL